MLRSLVPSPAWKEGREGRRDGEGGGREGGREEQAQVFLSAPPLPSSLPPTPIIRRQDRTAEVGWGGMGALTSWSPGAFISQVCLH
jgi:hypothetical protein